MAKKTKMKTKTRPTRKQGRLVPIPKAMKADVLKKFWSRKAKGVRVLAMRTGAGGFYVATFANGNLEVVRAFPVPTKGTEIPEPMWITAQLELAQWYAGHLAKHGQPPSAKQERGRRKRIWKRTVQTHQAHQATKQVMAGVTRTEPKPPVVRPPLKLRTFVVLYDPLHCLDRMEKTKRTFHVHTVQCPKLDQHRGRVARKKGDSWVLEGPTMDQVISEQLKEFDAEDMGYVRADFHDHACGDPESRRTVASRLAWTVRIGKGR